MPTRTMTAAFVVSWHLATAASPLLAQRVAAQEPSRAADMRARNPSSFTAVQLLARGWSARDEPVRFQWSNVEGAKAFVLMGRWTQPPSWTIQSRAYRVEPTNATTWTSDHVSFEVLLPPGSHSWRVAALFGAKLTGDTSTAPTFAFDIK